MKKLIAVACMYFLAAPAWASDVLSFDVAGVKLGMNVEAARSALAQRGYTLGDSRQGPSFDQRIQNGVADRRPNVSRVYHTEEATVRALDANGPNGEWVTIVFEAEPSGPRVSAVRLGINQERISREIFDRQIREKYGESDRFHGGQLRRLWCADNEASCEVLSFQREPRLTYSWFGPPSISLEMGPAYHDRIEAAVRAAVEAQAPRRGAAM